MQKLTDKIDIVIQDWLKSKDENTTNLAHQIVELIAGYNAALPPNTGMRWVKASERRPEKEGHYSCRHFVSKNVEEVFYRDEIPDDYEWLDESTQQGTGDGQDIGGWHEKEWMDFICWYSGMKIKSVEQGIKQYQFHLEDNS